MEPKVHYQCTCRRPFAGFAMTLPSKMVEFIFWPDVILQLSISEPLLTYCRVPIMNRHNEIWNEREKTPIYRMDKWWARIYAPWKQDRFITHGQQSCWWTGDARSTGVSSHCIDFVILEYPGLNTRGAIVDLNIKLSYDPQEQTRVKFCSKFILFHSRKYIWKCGLQNGTHLVSASVC